MRVRFTWNNPYSSVYDGSRFDSITSQNAAGDEDLAQRAKFSPGGLHRKFQVERKKKSTHGCKSAKKHKQNQHMRKFMCMIFKTFWIFVPAKKPRGEPKI